VFVYELNATHSAGPAGRWQGDSGHRGHWAHVQTLTTPEAVYPQHFFGARGSIAMAGDYAAVGAWGLEAVYLYRRVFDVAALRWVWEARPAVKLVSRDYDYDVILGFPRMHEQRFGVAVGLSGRTLVVGAPLADYGNRGDVDVRETESTDGVCNAGVGRGKVFVFDSSPPRQLVVLRADTPLYAGEFRLRMVDQNAAATTPALAYDALPAAVERALEQLGNVGDVDVSNAVREGGRWRGWEVTFLAATADPPLLEALFTAPVGAAVGAPWAHRNDGACLKLCANMSSPYSGGGSQVLKHGKIEREPNFVAF
jgi:hypothetical protein